MTGAAHVKLDALNFFLADVRGGMGAFVSVFLVTAANWSPAEVGVILTVSGLIGIAAHVPVGALIDAIDEKRTLIAVGTVLLAACAIAIERIPTGPVVFAADVVMAVLGGVFAPAVAALTLGLVPESQFVRRLARNAAWDRTGNITIAIIVGILGWWFSQRITFYLVPLFALLTMVVLISVPSKAINRNRARGFAPGQHNASAEPAWRALTANRPLLKLSMIAASFHFANAAMLPLVGQKLALANPGAETAIVSACIIVAQLVSVPVALFVGLNATRWGLRLLLATACAALLLRGTMFAVSNNLVVLLAAQVLDGVASGVWDVIIPLAVADLVIGSGRYSYSRGLLGTIQGIGGSISNGVAGVAVAYVGYNFTFAMLASFAAAACMLTALLPDPERIRIKREANVR